MASKNYEKIFLVGLVLSTRLAVISLRVETPFEIANPVESVLSQGSTAYEGLSAYLITVANIVVFLVLLLSFLFRVVLIEGYSDVLVPVLNYIGMRQETDGRKIK